MSKHDDGGPAFPNEFGCGLTLRDLFAGLMLAQMKPYDFARLKDTAECCYEIADAMLEARKTND